MYETRDKYCSSLLQPNKYYLNKFFESERFDVINKIKVSSTTIDKEFKNLQIVNIGIHNNIASIVNNHKIIHMKVGQSYLV